LHLSPGAQSKIAGSGSFQHVALFVVLAKYVQY